MSVATLRALATNAGVALAINLALVLLIAWLVLPPDAPLSTRRITGFVDFVRLVPARDDAARDARERLPPPPVLSPRPALPAPALPPVVPSAAAGGVAGSAAALPLPALPPLDAAATRLALGPAGAVGAAEGAGGGGASGAGGAGEGGAMLLVPDDVEVNLAPSYRAAPAYPLRALKEGIEGVVTVEFAIDADGNVREPRVLKADPPGLFDDAVLAALPRWKFSPKLVGGRPVARRARQDVVFRLHRQ